MRTPAPSDTQLASVVASKLGAADISWKSASDETGIPYATLHGRLKGATSFKASELARLGALLGTTGSALLAQAEDAEAGALAS